MRQDTTKLTPNLCRIVEVVVGITLAAAVSCIIIALIVSELPVKP
jgi:hypothetical protein